MNPISFKPPPLVRSGAAVGRARSQEPVAMNAPAPAPVSLTAPRKRAVTRAAEAIGTPTAQETRNSLREDETGARSVGVRTTTKSFVLKAAGIGLSALALAAAVSVAAATGGAALVAAAAVVGVVFAISVADAHCAYLNRQNARAMANGLPLPHTLPMGDSSVGNLVHWCATKLRRSPKTARIIANVIDRPLRIGLAVTAGICSAGTSAVAGSFEQVAPLAGTAVSTALTLLSFKDDWKSAGRYQAYKDSMGRNYDSMERQLADADNVPEEQRGLLQQEIAEGRLQSDADLESLAAVIPSRRAITVTSVADLAAKAARFMLSHLLLPGSAVLGVEVSSGPSVPLSTATGRQGLRQAPPREGEVAA